MSASPMIRTWLIAEASVRTVMAITAYIGIFYTVFHLEYAKAQSQSWILFAFNTVMAMVLVFSAIQAIVLARCGMFPYRTARRLRGQAIIYCSLAVIFVVLFAICATASQARLSALVWFLFAAIWALLGVLNCLMHRRMLAAELCRIHEENRVAGVAEIDDATAAMLYEIAFRRKTFGRQSGPSHRNVASNIYNVEYYRLQTYLRDIDAAIRSPEKSLNRLEALREAVQMHSESLKISDANRQKWRYLARREDLIHLDV